MNYPKKRDDVRVSVIDGEAVVLDRRHGLIHQLNPTASVVWERCDGRRTAREIAAELVEVFDIDLDTAVGDVEIALAQFHELNLLESQPGSPE